MSPRQLNEWPKEKDHEFSSRTVRYKGENLTAIYCKCQTTCLGVARIELDAKEIQREHLIAMGVFEE